MKLIFFSLIIVSSLLLATTVQATCAWTANVQCRDIGTYWMNGDAANCTNPKPSNVQRCCCTVGCCEYYKGPIGTPLINGIPVIKATQRDCETFVASKGTGWHMKSFRLDMSPDGKGNCEAISLPNIDDLGRIISDDTTSGNLNDDLVSGNPTTTNQLESYPNPLNTIDIRVVVGRIVRAILIIVGALALIMFVYGGFTWLTSAGNEQKVETGRSTLIWAALGLIIVFSAYVLVKYVMEAVGAI